MITKRVQKPLKRVNEPFKRVQKGLNRVQGVAFETILTVYLITEPDFIITSP